MIPTIRYKTKTSGWFRSVLYFRRVSAKCSSKSTAIDERLSTPAPRRLVVNIPADVQKYSNMSSAEEGVNTAYQHAATGTAGSGIEESRFADVWCVLLGRCYKTYCCWYLLGYVKTRDRWLRKCKDKPNSHLSAWFSFASQRSHCCIWGWDSSM